MKLALLLFGLIGCANLPPERSQEEPLVSVEAALNQAQSSYLKGCVEAYQSLKLGPSFFYCVENSRKHRLELQNIMDTPLERPLEP
jgi:hypothetical protein